MDRSEAFRRAEQGSGLSDEEWASVSESELLDLAGLRHFTGSNVRKRNGERAVQELESRRGESVARLLIDIRDATHAVHAATQAVKAAGGETQLVNRRVLTLTVILAVLGIAALLIAVLAWRYPVREGDVTSAHSTASSALVESPEPPGIRRSVDGVGTPIDRRTSVELKDSFPLSTGCSGLRQALLATVGVIDCAMVEAPAGAFAVALENAGEGHASLTVYAFATTDENGRVKPRMVRRSDPFVISAGAPDDLEPNYYAITVDETAVADFPVVLVSFEEAFVDGPVSSFDVIAWEEGEPEPTIAAHLGGEEGTLLDARAGEFFIRNSDYSDGSPACCPMLGAERIVRRIAPGRWVEWVTVRSYEEVFPGHPAE